YTDPELLHPEDLVWSPGINNFRVQYTAGYPVIPEAVQEACAEWVALLWYRTRRDPGVSSLNSGGVSQSFAAPDPSNPPAPIQALLAPYRRHTAAQMQS